MIEWIDHLHEHFVNPAVVTAGHYEAPSAPGASTLLRPESVAEFSYPMGPAWQAAMGTSGHPGPITHEVRPHRASGMEGRPTTT